MERMKIGSAAMLMVILAGCGGGKDADDGGLDTRADTKTDTKADVKADVAPDVPSDVPTGFDVPGPSCTDRILNGTETGVDCGGSCPGCAVGTNCGINADCQSGM